MALAAAASSIAKKESNANFGSTWQPCRPYVSTGAKPWAKCAWKRRSPAVNLMLNGWLLYQVIASRFLAHSGFYQSGGAYGFRDQLQDSMVMLHATPQSAR